MAKQTTFMATKGWLNTMNMTKKELVKYILSNTGGTIFSGSFTKKDGSLRVFNAKSTNLKYFERTVIAPPKCPNDNVVQFWDNNAPERVLADGTVSKWRSFNIDTLKTLRVKGVTYKFEV
jgi:hypothetical protein